MIKLELPKKKLLLTVSLSAVMAIGFVTAFNTATAIFNVPREARQLVAYIYPRYREEMDAGELADEIRMGLGYKLKADFPGDVVDGSVTISSEVIIVMPKLTEWEKAKLDEIVVSHYSEKIAKELKEKREPTVAYQYAYPRGDLTLEDIVALYDRIETELGIDVAAVRYDREKNEVQIVTYNKLDPQTKLLLDEFISKILGFPVVGNETKLTST